MSIKEHLIDLKTDSNHYPLFF